MTVSAEVVAAANELLLGDESGRAAATLEAALHAHHPYDEEFEDLLEALALYSPGSDAPYIGHSQLCEAVRKSPIGSASGDVRD